MGLVLGGAKILITGATGFMGQYVAGALSASGGDIIKVSKSLGFDLRNEAEALISVFKAKPNIVVHLAASREDKPAYRLKDDLSMHLNIVNASALAGAKMVTLFTDALYDDEAPGSSSQKALLSLMSAYREQFGMSYAALVAERAYGPGDTFVSGLARVFIQASEKKSASVEMTVSPTGFSLIHALDAANAIVNACAMVDEEDPLDLPGEPANFETLVNLMVEQTGFKGEVTLKEKTETNGHHVALDGSRAGSVLFWKPEMSLKDGVAQTIEWCRRFTNGVAR